MKINIKFISLLLILMFVSISAVSAASDDNQTIELNDNELEEINSISEIEEVASDNAKTFTDLQSQFWATPDGGTLILDSDYAYNDDFRNGRVIGIGVDTSDLTVDGQGHTIDGKSKSRILFVDEKYGNLVLKNINFINGYNSDGSGAILCKSPNITIINCTFENNNGGTLVGGAVSIFNSDNPTIMNSVFKNNKVSQTGGALRVEGDNQKIIGNTFINNVAEEKLGGAISSMGDNILIYNNTFTNNIAGRDGGAMNLQGRTLESLGKNHNVSYNKFYKNTALYAGAVSICGEECVVSYNEFDGDYATSLGGAIRIAGSMVTGKITNNIFKDNYADVSGGAIYVDGNGTTVSDNTFTNTYAKTVAGGAININGHNTIINNNKITKTSAKTVGGALYLNGDNIKITSNTIANAASESSGGAIYLTGAAPTIENNVISNSNSGSLGGAIFLKANKATIAKNEFTKNIAKSSGGAMYIEGNSITINANNFTSNEAGSTSVGGAIRLAGNNAIVSNNRFVKNTAKVATAIYGSGTNPSLSNNYYSDGETNGLKWESNTIKTTLTVESKTYSVISASKAISAVLRDANGKLISGKEIEFIVDGQSVKATTNGNGVAIATFTLSKVKQYPVTVNFAGDSIYEKSTQTAKITVNKEKTKATAPNKSYKKSAKNKKLTFTLKTSTNKAIKGKKITFVWKNKKYTGITKANGVATVKVKLTKKGTYKFTAKFAGDSIYKPVSKQVKLTLK